MRPFESGGSWARHGRLEPRIDDWDRFMAQMAVLNELAKLQDSLNKKFDAIHSKFLRNMDWLARSTGARTRIDRLKRRVNI